MKKWIVTPLILICLLVLVSARPTHASDATDSGTIQDKLKALEVEIASRASQLKLTVDKKLENRMFEGTVVAKTNSQLTLSPEYPDPDNPQNEVVLVNSFTNYTTTSKKLGQTVNNGDYIIALGDVDDKDNLTAKKVIITTPPDNSTIQSAAGKVLSVDGLTITVSGKNNQTEHIFTDWNTSFYSGSDEITLSKIDTGRFVVGIGTQDGKSLKARFVYLAPVEVVKTPSPSASESASPSSTPKK